MVLLVRCANTLCKRYVLVKNVMAYSMIDSVLRNEISSLDYSETLQFAFIGHGYNKMGRISRYELTMPKLHVLTVHFSGGSSTHFSSLLNLVSVLCTLCSLQTTYKR